MVIPGSVRIGGAGFRGQVLVTYYLPPAITSVSASACVGGTITINGTNLNGATAADVKIGGTAVASITSNNGAVIIAVISTGSTGTVSVTTPGGTATSSTSFTVNQLPAVSTLTSQTGINAMCVASSLQLIPGTAGGVWSSLNPTIATIDNSGLVAGVSVGTASINYTITNNNGCSSTATKSIILTTTPNPVIEFTQGANDHTAAVNASACGSIIGGGQNDLDIFSGNPTSGTLSYQWQVSTNNGSTWINGGGPTSTTTQYVLNPIYTNYEVVPGIYLFRLAITNNGCTGYSNSITMTVTGQPNLTAGSVASNGIISFCNGGDPNAFTQLTAPTGGASPANYVYQWLSSTDNINFTPISGATSATYDAPSITQTTYYRRAVVSGGCSATSNTISVIISTNPPATPGVISGPTTVCPNTAGIIYSVVADPTVTTYNWTLPSGWSITAGSGTASITVTTGLTTGNIAVTAVNICGSSLAPSTLTITTVNTLPTITGLLNICAGGTSNLTGSGTSAASSPWISAAPLIASINGTGLVTGIATGTSLVTYTNNNGCTASATVTINALPTVNAGAAVAAICPGGTTSLLGGSFGGGATGATWSDGGAGGVFTNNGTVNATYTASAAAPATVTLTLTTTGGSCGVVTDSKILTINTVPGSLQPSVTAICPATPVTFAAPAGYDGYIFKINGAIVQNYSTNSDYNTAGLTGGELVTVDIYNNGCISTLTAATVTINVVPVPTLTADKTTICQGQTINFTATGGVNYAFKINNTIVQNGTAATYTSNTSLPNGASVTVDVTNAAGCTATIATPIVITVNAIPAGILTTTATTVCKGDNISFTATGGTAGTTFRFNLNATTIAQDYSASNTFSTTALADLSVITVSVKNAAGCISNYSPGVQVTVNDLPTGVVVGTTENSGTANDNVICFGDAVTFTATTGFANYNFKVNNVSKQSGATNSYITNSLNNGEVVTVEVSNSTGCKASFNPAQQIAVNGLPVAGLTTPITTICTGANVLFTATAGFSNYQFLLNGNQVQNGNSNTYLTNNLTTNDVISVNITNINGCSKLFSTAAFVVNALPVIPAITGTPIVCVNKTTTFSNTIAGGSWSSSNAGIATVNSSGIVTGITAGTATITYSFTNANGCTSSNALTVTVNPLPTVAALTGIMSVCVNSTTQLASATTGGTWSSSNGAVATVDANGVVTAVSTGTATITYTVINGFGCTSFSSATVTVNALPVLPVITGTTNVCVSKTTTLSNTTSGGSWSSSDAAFATVSNTGVVTGIAAGTATITYTFTNANGCTSSATALVTINALPILTSITGTTTVCVNSTQTLSNSAGAGAWISTTKGVATVGLGTGIVTGVAAGTTTINYTYTNGNGCASTVSAIVTVNALPVPTLSGPNPICQGSTGNFYATESGQSNYVWTITNGTVTNGGTIVENNLTISWLSAGAKNITVNYTDANGCKGAKSATVLNAPSPSLPTITGTNALCQGTAGAVYTTESGSGRKNYVWTISGGTITAGAGTSAATVTWNVAGSNSINVNYDDINGCSPASPTAYAVTVNPLPTATIGLNAGSPSAVCVNGTVPAIKFSAAGGVAPYTFTYKINGGTNLTATAAGNTTTVNAAVTTAGTYNYTLVSVQDSKSCAQLQSGTATITVNPLPSATIAGTAAICQDLASPTITLTGSLGTSPYTFTYNINGGASQTVTTTSGNSVTVAAPTNVAGSFIYNLVTVEDASSTACAKTITGQSATITVNATPTLLITNPASVCTPFTVNLQTQIATITSGSTTGLTFSYFTNALATTTYPNSTTATNGTYYIKGLKASTGCYDVEPVTVTVNPTSVGGTLSPNAATVCYGSTGTINLTANTGNVIRWEFSLTRRSTLYCNF